MKKEIKSNFILSGVLFVLFIVFTVIVKTVDVQYLGQTDTAVGLGSLNGAFYDLIYGWSGGTIWYEISEYLGYVAILAALVFVCVGAFQLLKTKSLKGVDRRIYILAGFYVLVAVFYVLFEMIVINYRPVYIDGIMEASYPSSHTMLTLCILGSAMILFDRLIRDKKGLSLLFNCFASVVMVLTIAGRLLSCVHWVTDIIGGILLSCALVVLFYSVVCMYETK